MRITSATSWNLPEKLTYPYIGITKQSDKIVLFTKEKTGIVLHAGSGCDPVGFWSASWAESNFEPYYEAITVQLQR